MLHLCFVCSHFLFWVIKKFIIQWIGHKIISAVIEVIIKLALKFTNHIFFLNYNDHRILKRRSKSMMMIHTRAKERKNWENFPIFLSLRTIHEKSSHFVIEKFGENLNQSMLVGGSGNKLKSWNSISVASGSNVW